jgi:hypothetical protein
VLFVGVLVYAAFEGFLGIWEPGERVWVRCDEPFEVAEVEKGLSNSDLIENVLKIA